MRHPRYLREDRYQHPVWRGIVLGKGSLRLDETYSVGGIPRPARESDEPTPRLAETKPVPKDRDATTSATQPRK